MENSTSSTPAGHGAYVNDCATTAIQQMIPERRLNSTSPHSEPDRAPRRSLPSREVTDDNFDDAYVDFIMHCNPSVPLDTDTSELRKSFRSPPKSDGKTFSSFALFELIRKLESKEIKTWAQLAIDLGVEPPALDKGQSAQKVQQYAVRLKRWMHAMHVDAFFEYLLNKTHTYWTQVPSINEPSSEFGRDGVTSEEDLALRALLPEFRPKRGRRKAEDKDIDSEGKSPQRRRLDSPTLSEDFMIARASLIGGGTTPASAHPSFNHTFDNRLSSWSWAQNSTETAQTPLTAYPQSAMTPASNRSGLWADIPEPQSAITPNKSRSRRKHGPTVSSAWSSSAGKLRGRPPSNRSVTDGPFSMFPANPSLRETPTINLRDNPLSATPIIGDSEMPHFFPPSTRSPNHLAPNPTNTPPPERASKSLTTTSPTPTRRFRSISNLASTHGPPKWAKRQQHPSPL
ncbi:hypothetical protein B7494_g3038 [Chlorociboria aeruginascens]|nr:hypothetical protein B7494_g3038 [Chlorociboria aeruginascens]